MSMYNPEVDTTPVDLNTIYDEQAYLQEIAEFDAKLENNPESLFPPLTPVVEVRVLSPADEAELALEKAVNSARAMLMLGNNEQRIKNAFLYGETALEVYRKNRTAAQHLESPNSLLDPLIKLALNNAEYIESTTSAVQTSKSMFSRLSDVFKR